LKAALEGNGPRPDEKGADSAAVRDLGKSEIGWVSVDIWSRILYT